MNKNEVLKMINENLHYINKAKENLYRGKVFVLADSNRVNEFFKTKRGAEGYKKRNDNFSYYDDYSQELVSTYSGEMFEIQESEIIDITENKYFWFKYLKSNMGSIHAYNSGDNIIYEAKKTNVSEEIMDYIKEAIEDIKNNRGLTVVEEPVKEIEKVEEVTEIVVEPQQEEIKEEIEQSENNNTLDVEVKFNEEKNGIELYFSDKPSEAIRSQLKANKFRWAKYNKCWYVKDTEEARAFLSELGLLNQEGQQENKTIVEDEIREMEIPVVELIEINEENFPISKEISKRENDSCWTFRTKERDHQQEILNYLNDYKENFTKELNKLEDKIELNKLIRWFNRFAKRSYENYYKKIKNKADNPSMAVTGSAGRSIRRYEKMNDRYDNLMRESIALSDEFENKIYSIESKISRQEHKKYSYAVMLNEVEFTYKTVKMKVDSYALDNHFSGDRTKEKNCYMTSVNGKVYYIIKAWGSFKAVDENGMNVLDNSCDTLKGMKKILNYHLAQIYKEAV